MKRLVLIGILLIVTAMPCWGGGKEDLIAAAGRWDAGSREDALDLYPKAISSGDLSDAEMVDAHYNTYNDRAMFYIENDEYGKAIDDLEQLKSNLVKQEGITVAQ